MTAKKNRIPDRWMPGIRLWCRHAKSDGSHLTRIVRQISVKPCCIRGRKNRRRIDGATVRAAGSQNDLHTFGFTPTTGRPMPTVPTRRLLSLRSAVMKMPASHLLSMSVR